MTRTPPSQGKKITISPLRYPGGKSLLYTRLREIIRHNNPTPSTYVEPYAGGASTALALLVTGQVPAIHINDIDHGVFAFWQAVINQPHEFTHRLRTVDLTVTEWENQRRAYLTADPDDHLTLGFATFYLNRTNRSGHFNGGPIGGKDQTGNFLIDARFNREGLAERIRAIALYADHITVTNCDGLNTIAQHADDPQAFIYADPPYFDKGPSLYANAFTKPDHDALAESLTAATSARWVLTYDNVPHVADLYPHQRRRLFTLTYSARNYVRAQEVMVISDTLTIPDAIEADHHKLAADTHAPMEAAA